MLVPFFLLVLLYGGGGGQKVPAERDNGGGGGNVVKGTDAVAVASPPSSEEEEGDDEKDDDRAASSIIDTGISGSEIFCWVVFTSVLALVIYFVVSAAAPTPAEAVVDTVVDHDSPPSELPAAFLVLVLAAPIIFLRFCMGREDVDESDEVDVGVEELLSYGNDIVGDNVVLVADTL